MKYLFILATLALSFGFVGCSHDHDHAATTTTTTTSERTVSAAPTGSSTTVVRSAY